MEPAPQTPSPVAGARRRVVVAFAAFAGGLLAARSLDAVPSLTWFSIAAALCAAAVLSRAWVCRASMALTVAALGAGWLALKCYEPPSDSVASVLAREDGSLITIEGVLQDDPHPARRGGTLLSRFEVGQARLRFDIAVDRIIGEAPAAASGKLWVRLSAGKGHDALDLRAGDRVRLTGMFEPVAAPMNPGEDDLRVYANEVGYSGSLSLSDPRLVERLQQPDGLTATYHSAWLRWRATMEARARDIVSRASGGQEGDPGRSLLLGLVLGDYDPAQHEVRDAFARQGLAHILSISGFHLSVMALLALVLLRLTGDRGWLEPVIVAALVLAYLAIVPPSSPILRSAIMVLVLLAAEASGRRYDRLTLLGWIAIVLLIWRPLDLWSIGFQLSLGLTGALFWIGNSFNARIWRQPLKGTVHREVSILQRLLEHLKQSVSTGIMCWTLSLPLIACRIGIVSPLAIAATVIVTPLIVLVLLIGYIALLIGVFIPTAADAAGHVLSWLSEGSVRSVQLFDSLPLSAIRIPVVSPLWAFAATALAAYWVRRGHRRDALTWAGAAIVGAWLAWFLVFGPALPRHTPLRLDTLSVGSGTCHLIRSGSDAMLWDCGPMKQGGVQPPLVQSVRALGAWRTPTVVITHPDLDHFAGLPEVLEPLGVREVLFCERFVQQASDQPRSAAAALLRELDRRHIPYRTLAAGDTFPLGTVTFTILSPPRGSDWKLDNDHSLVARVDLAQPSAEASLLLTGDIQEDAIAAIESVNPTLHARVLELPHHGSAHRAAIDFAARLDPQIVLQSTNASRLDDPRWSAVRPGRLWYTTAHCGAAWVELHDDDTLTSGGLR